MVAIPIYVSMVFAVDLLHLFPPGVGKTTLIRKVSAALQENGIDLHGFYTEEVRSSAGRGGGPRIGFDVVTFDGKRGPLARVGRLCRLGACIWLASCFFSLQNNKAHQYRMEPYEMI